MLEIDRAKGYLIGRRGQGEQVPAVVLRGEKFDGTVIVWVIPEGKAGLLKDGKPSPAIKAALDAGAAVVGVDVFGTGELAMDRPHGVNARMAGYTFGYNRTVLGQRCHDILTAISFARAALPGVKRVHLAGAGKAGPWVMLARGLAGDAVTRTAADVTRFRFESVKSADDEMMFPGALKYAGLGGLASLAAPHEVYLHNHQGSGIGKWTKATYKAADAPKALESHADRKSASDVMAWLLR